jgi:hypothetical protein
MSAVELAEGDFGAVAGESLLIAEDQADIDSTVSKGGNL